MNRRSFLRILGVGAAAGPSVLKAAITHEPRQKIPVSPTLGNPTPRGISTLSGINPQRIARLTLEALKNTPFQVYDTPRNQATILSLPDDTIADSFSIVK